MLVAVLAREAVVEIQYLLTMTLDKRILFFIATSNDWSADTVSSIYYPYHYNDELSRVFPLGRKTARA